MGIDPIANARAKWAEQRSTRRDMMQRHRRARDAMDGGPGRR